MDTLRSNFGTGTSDESDWQYEDDANVHEILPVGIKTDERRMQVRAYNHWANSLNGRSFPSIADVNLENLPDFGPHCVLLDFTNGYENPAINFLGEEIAKECGTDLTITKFSDVPARSLLSRITDHFMQIIANQAPVGFEAEFVNQRLVTILYRGIMLPYSSDGENIDFIYGVINWKEAADDATTKKVEAELAEELARKQATKSDRSANSDLAPLQRRAGDITEWADGPASEPLTVSKDNFPAPSFLADDGDDEGEDQADVAASRLSALIKLGSRRSDAWGAEDSVQSYDPIAAGSAYPLSQAEIDSELRQVANLHACLADARELARFSITSEDRSRAALYAAVSRAYDVALAGLASPEEFDAVLAENNLRAQTRAPLTPVVKLVFGADYDKTRLAEFAAILAHALRSGLKTGELEGYLASAKGGLKAIVSAERAVRSAASGVPFQAKAACEIRAELAERLRRIKARPLAEFDAKGAEFAAVMIRRQKNGKVVVLGEVSDDIALVEKLARKIA